MARKKPDKTIRIKYYGLFPITKRAYLTSTAILAAVLVIGLPSGYFAGFLPPLSTLWGWHWASGSAADATPWPWLYQYFYWAVIGGVVAELIVSIRMLRGFARLEAEQRARETARDTAGRDRGAEMPKEK